MAPLARALDKNEHVKDVVEQSASELLVINSVLKQEIPDHLQVGEVAQALHKTDMLEIKIHDTVEDLATVNKLLEHEIDERIDLERELLATKAALKREQAKP